MKKYMENLYSAEQGLRALTIIYFFLSPTMRVESCTLNITVQLKIWHQKLRGENVQYLEEPEFGTGH